MSIPPAVRLLAVAATLMAAAPLPAQQVLIINGASATSEPGVTAGITTQLTTLHSAVGNVVTVSDGRPADLTPYKQVWDIRFDDSWALTASDEAAYLAFLQGGGGMFLMGENSGFMNRNISLFDFIMQAGGGTIGFDISGPNMQSVCSPFTGPDPVSWLYYVAAGYFDGKGTGQWITAPACNSITGGSGIAFGVGSLANAPAGTLTTILDVNFMEPDANGRNQALARNLVGYVGDQVTPTPEPASLILMATGLAGVVGVARRRRGSA